MDYSLAEMSKRRELGVDESEHLAKGSIDPFRPGCGHVVVTVLHVSKPNRNPHPYIRISR